MVAAVLSGNRNFEGRVNPLVKANYLASPPLVVAYALAGTVDIDLTSEPLGTGIGRQAGLPARHLADAEEVAATVRAAVDARDVRARIRAGLRWRRQLAGICRCRPATSSSGTTQSTYIKKPPYFEQMVDPATPIHDFAGMRVLAVLGDSVTTDHISPAGSIAEGSPAGSI